MNIKEFYNKKFLVSIEIAKRFLGHQKFQRNFLVFLIIIFIISSLFCFTVKYLGMKEVIPWFIGYSDISPFNKIALQPGLPYIDKDVEYPVITGLFIHLTGLGKTKENYFLLSSFFLVLFGLLTLITLYKLVLEKGIDKKRLIIFFAAAPSILFFMIYNWDLIAIFFTVLSLYFFRQKKDVSAAIFLSLGFNAKLFPILLLPIMLLKRDSIIKWVKIIFSFFITSIIVNIYFIIKNFDGWLFFYTFNSLREPNPDSMWGIIYRFSGIEIKLIGLISLVLFLILYLFIIFYYRKKNIYYLGAASILLFLIFNKVFSPQYILWLLPFFILIPKLNKISFYSLEISNLIVLFSILPWIFIIPKIDLFLNISQFFVIVRHIIMIYLVYFILKQQYSTNL